VKELKDKIIQHSLFDSPSEYAASSVQPLSLTMSKEALLAIAAKQVFINAAFWNYAPIETKPRQKLELDLIYH
jgi:hypothetical protein